MMKSVILWEPIYLKIMDSEEVEMTSPSSIVALPNEAENTTKTGDVINLSDKHVNTLFSYFQKK